MYKFLDRFILRSPLLSYSALDEILQSRDSIKAYVETNPEVYKAIFLASQQLSNQIKKEKFEKKVVDSLVKYLCRMSTRPTPYGLFSSLSIGKFDNHTELIIDSSINENLKIDSFVLFKLYHKLIADKEVYKQLIWYPNTSLYKVGKNYRYIELKHSDFAWSPIISQIQSSKYLTLIIKLATKGKKRQQLLAELINNEIDEDDAALFVDDLISNQVLINDATPDVYGQDYLNLLVEKSMMKKNELGILHSIKTDLQNKKFTLNEYKKIINKVDSLGLNIEENQVLQANAFRPTLSNSLRKENAEEFSALIKMLSKIQSSKFDPLISFKEGYIKKYGNTAVPLLIALDPDIGVLYKSEMKSKELSIDNLIPRNNFQKHLPPQVSLNRFELVLLDKILKKPMTDEILLTDEDLENLPTNPGMLAPTYNVFCEGFYNKGKENFLIKSCGSPGATLISRFSDIHPEIQEITTQICDFEDTFFTEYKLAEINFDPNYRVGNILFRQNLRRNKIVCRLPNKKGADISLNDLHIKIVDNEIILFLPDKNIKIIPKFTSSFNYSLMKIPAYNLLFDMQNQYSINSLFFSWGSISKILKYFPRIRYKKFILSPRKWFVQGKEFLNLIDSVPKKTLNNISVWAKKQNIPNRVLLLEGSDNLLYINLENEICIELLKKSVTKVETFTLIEFLYTERNSLVRDINNKQYVNEIIFFLNKSVENNGE